MPPCTTKIADIRSGERQRKEIGHMPALADNIERFGLMHLVRPDGKLFAGELGWVAQLTVLEGNGRPRFAAQKPFDGGLAPRKAITAQRANALTDHGHGRSHNNSRED
jgi:hypothetical protein